VNNRGLALQPRRFCRSTRLFVVSNDGHRLGTQLAAAAGVTFSTRRFVMRRATALCAAVGIAVSALAVVSPAQAGYYVIRWDNTGICQIWN